MVSSQVNRRVQLSEERRFKEDSSLCFSVLATCSRLSAVLTRLALGLVPRRAGGSRDWASQFGSGLWSTPVLPKSVLIAESFVA